jgi:hypothetical protein
MLAFSGGNRSSIVVRPVLRNVLAPQVSFPPARVPSIRPAALPEVPFRGVLPLPVAVQVSGPDPVLAVRVLASAALVQEPAVLRPRLKAAVRSARRRAVHAVVSSSIPR